MNIPNIDLPRIVVIGCGFAGLKFCNKIDSSKYQIVLFDKNNYHTFQPLLYQVATSGLEPDSIVYPVRKIFKGKPNFFFRMAEISHINSEEKTIFTSIGNLSYTYLVIATGATSNFFGLKNIENYAMPMKSLVESLNLRSVILQNFESALNEQNVEKRESYMNFVIVGGGPTGVELAGALSELKSQVLPFDYPDLDLRRMQIHIVEASDRLLASMSHKASHKTKKYLKQRNVHIWTNTRVKDYDGEFVTTSGETFRSKTVIWAAGIQGNSPKGIKASFSPSNRILVNEVNQINGYENVYAVGDVAQISSEKYPKGNPMLGSVAEQQGAWLAKNFNAFSNGREMKPFSYKDRGTMATIGRNKAVVDLNKITFGGFMGWLTWMFVHLMLLVDFRSRIVVFVNWVWSYLLYDKGTRLIVRKFDRKNP